MYKINFKNTRYLSFIFKTLSLFFSKNKVVRKDFYIQKIKSFVKLH